MTADEFDLERPQPQYPPEAFEEDAQIDRRLLPAKPIRVRRRRAGHSRFAGTALWAALGATSITAFLLFLNASGSFAWFAFAAPSEMEAKHPFYRAGQKLNATGKLVVIAFGSSSTLGARASSPDRAYPAMLEKYLNSALGPDRAVRVLNRGIGGEDVNTMMARLERDVLRDKPDIVIWQTGTNDPLHNISLWRFILKTREGIRQMQDAGIAVVLMGPQVSRRTSGITKCLGFRDALRAIGEEMGLPVIKRYDLIRKWLADGTATEAEIMHPDGLHMADEGYRRLAAEVAAELLSDLGIRAGLNPSTVQH
jgi:acyl-CoA thioesterase I